MNAKRRQKNEAEYEFWVEKENGNRIYSFEISGKMGWKAKYLKEVDSEEETIRFWQEIYDEKNSLREFMKNTLLTRDTKKYKDDHKKSNS